MSDCQVIDAGFTPQATKDQEKYLKAWQLYSATCNIDPFVQGCDQFYTIIVVTPFSALSRQGYYGKGVQIKIPTVAKALSAITTSIHLVRKSCPFKTTEDDYILPVKRLTKGLWNNDPPPIPQLALPISVPNECCARGGPVKITAHTGNWGSNSYSFILYPELQGINRTPLCPTPRWYLHKGH